MERKQKTLQYFPGAITYKGFTSFWESNLEGIEQIYILKGGPGTGKSTFMQQIAKAMLEQGHKIELLWCSSDARSLDGAIFRELSLAILDGTAPHMRDPKYPGVRDAIVDLGKFWQRDELIAHSQEIIKLTDRNKQLYTEVYEQLKKARDFEKRNHALFNIRIDEEALYQWVEELVKSTIVCNQIPNEPSHHRWQRVSAPQGMVSFLDELQEMAKVCHCLKTKERQFASRALEMIAKQVSSKGYAIWYCHDPYESDWLEAIYLPQIECLFYQVEVVDGDNTCQMHKLDEWYTKSINRRNRLESEFLLDAATAARCKGQALLKENKSVHDELEVYYVRAMDFDLMNIEKQDLMQEFLRGGGFRK